MADVCVHEKNFVLLFYWWYAKAKMEDFEKLRKDLEWAERLEPDDPVRLAAEMIDEYVHIK
jgi:hypothetical protein